MTENEAIEVLKDEHSYGYELNKACLIAIQALSEIQQYRAIGTVEEVRMLKDYKELYDVYKLIGTIEEFRNLKYKKNVLPIATIEFSKEDMQKIVDEKVAQIELDIQGIRAKTIDEFVKKICEKYTEKESKGNYRQYCCNIKQELADIAEQLKAGEKNE